MTEVYIAPSPPSLVTTIDDPSNRFSAVSWAAIFAGAAGAAALSLLLLFLGTGLGLTAVSPWASEGISAASFGFAAIAWLSFTQLAASGMGGYLAGRLCTKWTAVHSDEVYFRDTAGETAVIPVAEVTRIFTRALRTGTLPQEDKRYVSQLIVQRSDLSQHQAEQRVLEGFDNVQVTLKEATNEAREASAYVALWMFVALLMGAFTASLMAVFGGRQRDAASTPTH